jgi:hypothetical protein
MCLGYLLWFDDDCFLLEMGEETTGSFRELTESIWEVGEDKIRASIP